MTLASSCSGWSTGSGIGMKVMSRDMPPLADRALSVGAWMPGGVLTLPCQAAGRLMTK